MVEVKWTDRIDEEEEYLEPSEAKVKTDLTKLKYLTLLTLP